MVRAAGANNKTSCCMKKGGKKVTRVAVNGQQRQNVQKEAHARSSAREREKREREGVFNSPNKCRKCEAVSEKKPRWTEKRLQYDLFREA